MPSGGSPWHSSSARYSRRIALGVHADAIRTGVVVAEDAVGQLVDELVGIEAERGAVVESLREEVGTGRVGPSGEEGAEPVGDAGLGRTSTEVRLPPHELRFGECELAEQEERGARRGGEPVGVAASRVEHRNCQLLGGHGRAFEKV